MEQMPVTSSVDDNAQQAAALVDELARLLDQEFVALKQQDAATVEQLQPSKTSVLHTLAGLAAAARAEGPLGEAWESTLARVAACQDAHRRNEYLARRQLDAVQNTLAVLHADASSTGVDLYDKLGQLSRRLGPRAYGAF